MLGKDQDEHEGADEDEDEDKDVGDDDDERGREQWRGRGARRARDIICLSKLQPHTTFGGPRTKMKIMTKIFMLITCYTECTATRLKYKRST